MNIITIIPTICFNGAAAIIGIERLRKEEILKKFKKWQKFRGNYKVICDAFDKPFFRKTKSDAIKMKNQIEEMGLSTNCEVQKKGERPKKIKKWYSKFFK